MSKTALCGVAVLAFAALPLFGHHGTATSYNQKIVVKVKGTVKEFVWRNPHSELFIIGKDESGNAVTYAVECGSPGQLAKIGMTRKTFQPGDQVDVETHPSFVNPASGERTGRVWVNGKELPLAARERDQPAGPENN
jgi:Family of unknown function (DUF6152)